MCIIVIKEKGVKLPDTETLTNCWYANADGAGYAYVDGGEVVIRKGFMTLPDLRQSLTDIDAIVGLTDVPMIMHFRIGTAGDNSAANTHPFPLSESLPALAKTRAYTPVAVAHNGIINAVTPRNKKISDTVEFVASIAAPLQKLQRGFYLKDDGKKVLANIVKSKLAFLDAAGNISTVGNFITDEETGLIFSNDSYLPYVPKTYTGMYGAYYTATKSKTSKKVAKEQPLSYKPLMFIDYIDGAYIVDEKGLPADPFDVMMAENGGLYQYDWELDIAIPIKGAAFTFVGNPLKFDDDIANWIIVEE